MQAILFPSCYIKGALLKIGALLYDDIIVITPTNTLDVKKGKSSTDLIYSSIDTSLNISQICPAPLDKDKEQLFYGLVSSYLEWAQNIGLGNTICASDFLHSSIEDPESISAIINEIKKGGISYEPLHARLFLELSRRFDRYEEETMQELSMLNEKEGELREIIDFYFETQEFVNGQQSAHKKDVDPTVPPLTMPQHKKRLWAWWSLVISENSLLKRADNNLIPFGESKDLCDMIDTSFEKIASSSPVTLLNLPFNPASIDLIDPSFKRGLKESFTALFLQLISKLDLDKAYKMAKDIEDLWDRGKLSDQPSPLRLIVNLYPMIAIKDLIEMSIKRDRDRARDRNKDVRTELKGKDKEEAIKKGHLFSSCYYCVFVI